MERPYQLGPTGEELAARVVEELAKVRALVEASEREKAEDRKDKALRKAEGAMVLAHCALRHTAWEARESLASALVAVREALGAGE